MAFGLGPRIRGALLENLNLKLLSLGFALVLYSLVHGVDAQRTVLVPVYAIMPPEAMDRVLVKEMPAQIRVSVKGPKTIINDLTDKEISAVQIDLRDGKESQIAFADLVQVPPGVQVERIEPPVLYLEWEDRIEREIPVQASVVGAPQRGFVVKGNPIVNPPTIAVKGPKSEVMVMQHVRVEPFDVTGLTEGSTTLPLKLDKPPSNVTFSAPSVQVTLEIVREVIEVPFTKLPVAITGQLKARAQPPDVDVRVTCPPEIVRALRAEQLVPRVQTESTAEKGSEALPVLLSVAGCDVRVTPSSVIVRWGKEKE